MSQSHDIDTIIREVRSALPTVVVVQMHKSHPADDDGLWWFRLPGGPSDIQIESSTHDCPFYIEHDDMISSAEALKVHSVFEVITAVVSFLRSKSSTN